MYICIYNHYIYILIDSHKQCDNRIAELNTVAAEQIIETQENVRM